MDRKTLHMPTLGATIVIVVVLIVAYHVFIGKRNKG